MTIFEKLAFHQSVKALCRIKRRIAKDQSIFTYGYVLAYSDDFVLVKEVGDHRIDGCKILPISAIVKIRHNEFDKYNDYILESENLKDQVKNCYNLDLTNWQTIFTSIQKIGLNCTVENESDKYFFFKIGPVVKVKKKSILLQNFDPAGYIDEEPTKIRFKEITTVGFDDNYTNVFGKYLRKRD